MTNELLYQIALTQIPNIGHVHARTLLQHFGNAPAVFKATESTLEKIEGIGSVRARSIRSFKDFRDAEAEVNFIEQYKIQPLFITEPSYPQRLLHCYDAPVLLYYKGEANLNASKLLAVVGTRRNTEYGKQVTESLVEKFSGTDAVIVSGLAYGIDAVAHKCALQHALPTVGVLGHGLNQIYPPGHNNLAREMLKQGGGLLTEFSSKTPPDKHNFPGRNRIVAGISDAVILVETDIKGGSMITADIANSYNRDVFAVPGRTTDTKSEGCNYLIRNNKAILLTDASELMEIMGWKDKTTATPKAQKELFVELDEEEKKIIGLLKEKESTTIDELNIKSGLSTSSVAGALLQLELKGVIASLPGKMYKLI